MFRKLTVIFLALFPHACSLPESAPKGYLVPTPASIPVGMRQDGPYVPYKKDMYALAYTSEDHTSGGNLIISENPTNPEDNFHQSVQNYELLISRSIRDSKGCVADFCPLLKGAEKVRDIDYMGAHGVLFHTIDNANSTRISGYDLYMDDDGKLLRIFAYDGPNYHFTEDLIMKVLYGMVRQQ